MNDLNYIGDELTIFKEAHNWKSYWLNTIKKYIKGDVLEVGSGIGINTNLILQNCPEINRLVAIEPDNELYKNIPENVDLTPSKIEIHNCLLKDMPKEQKFDTIIYIDVIEHIENDAAELELARTYLNKNGHLIILVPAHNFLFSPFDRSIGHFRRYNKTSLVKSSPKALKMSKIYYLDSLGMLASLVNKYVLKQEYPTRKQILTWDRMIVPLSRVIDKLTFNSCGKTLVGIWVNNRIPQGDKYREE